jgi:hypothetical protein
VHRVRLVVADARNLAAVTETSFDAVLLMGPLYHLIEKQIANKQGSKPLLACATAACSCRRLLAGLGVSATCSRIGQIGSMTRPK